MSFLNPAILFGLFAVSIPILIHLLNLRKIRKVEFSTLMFLKELQKSKMRRIKLKQILLLLLRIFAIVFLVLSFAQPVYEGVAGSGNQQNKTTIIFIDDSFSMDTRDNNGLYLNQAKESVKKILESNAAGEIYFIPSSEIQFKNKSFIYENASGVLDSLDKIKSADKPVSMEEILGYSDKILSEIKNPLKEIFIISDFQKSNFSQSMISENFENLKNNSVNLFLVKVGTREANNLSLDSFTVVSKIIEKERDVKLKVFITNHTLYSLSNKTISLYVDNQLREEKAIDINSSESREINFTFKPGKSGSISGYFELTQSQFSDDEIIRDNKYFFSIYIPEKFNIGFIADNSSDYRFAELAFKSAVRLLSDSIKKESGFFKINAGNKIGKDIFVNNVLFIFNKKAFTDDEANILKDYISQGGGVFFFLGKNTDINNYNESVFSKINSLKIDKLNSDKQANENLRFERIDFEHPVLSDVFQNQNLNITSDRFNIESPVINSYFELLPSEKSTAIITLNNNNPFLTETKFSQGKIIVCCVDALADLSDFPMKNIFVPLLIRSVYYLGNDFNFQKTYTVGNQNLVAFRNIGKVERIILPDKTGKDFKINAYTTGEHFIALPYSPVTSQIGNYILEDSAGMKFDFSLNNNPSESNLKSYSNEELINYFSGNEIKNVKVIEATENISATINQSANGFELWKYFLAASALLILAEILFSKKLEDS